MTGIDSAIWDEALRLLREKGDPTLLGALLWRATPDGEGTTSLPTRVVYELAAIFATEAANPGPHPGFQGIEPIVPKEKRSFGCIRRRLYGIRFHGVISIGALTPNAPVRARCF
jgi:hypothetical protein